MDGSPAVQSDCPRTHLERIEGMKKCAIVAYPSVALRPPYKEQFQKKASAKFSPKKSSGLIFIPSFLDTSYFSSVVFISLSRHTVLRLRSTIVSFIMNLSMLKIGGRVNSTK